MGIESMRLTLKKESSNALRALPLRISGSKTVCSGLKFYCSYTSVKADIRVTIACLVIRGLENT